MLWLTYVISPVCNKNASRKKYIAKTRLSWTVERWYTWIVGDQDHWASILRAKQTKLSPYLNQNLGFGISLVDSSSMNLFWWISPWKFSSRIISHRFLCQKDHFPPALECWSGCSLFVIVLQVWAGMDREKDFFFFFGRVVGSAVWGRKTPVYKVWQPKDPVFVLSQLIARKLCSEVFFRLLFKGQWSAHEEYLRWALTENGQVWRWTNYLCWWGMRWKEKSTWT